MSGSFVVLVEPEITTGGRDCHLVSADQLFVDEFVECLLDDEQSLGVRWKSSTARTT
jgi:hypothetical protein